MRKKIVAGNWKMNLTKEEALNLYDQLNSLHLEDNKDVLVFPSYIYLDALMQRQHQVKIGAQNFYPLPKGAYTGEVSITHLSDLKLKYVLIGHSERRLLFGEDDTLIRKKVDIAIEQQMHVIFCCGEPLEIREEKKHKEYVLDQLKNNLFQLNSEDFDKLIIAYEPVWAIGTGKTASTSQAEEMHHFIRFEIGKNYGQNVADKLSILYGGSCNAENAAELFSCENIDGGLIGGASLKAEDFIKIVETR